MTSVTLSISFTSEDAMVEWYRELRSLGMVPTTGGLRHADLLDGSGRVSPGEFLATSEPGVADWTVPPRAPQVHGMWNPLQ